MPKTVLVTGGTGWIASQTITELLGRGYDVRATVRDLTREKAVRSRIEPHVDAGDRLSFVAAELRNDAGWEEAMRGCGSVIHMATPMGTQGGGGLATMVDVAREGTVRVLKAAVGAGVARVVMTSSAETVTLNAGTEHTQESLNGETLWTDTTRKGLDPYPESKTIAEQAWDFIRSQGDTTALTTILPSAVLGPVLTGDNLGTPQIIQAMLTGRMPATPNIGFHVSDVRDIAVLHVRALEAREAAGERFLAAGEWAWMANIATILRDGLGQRANKVPTRRMPDLVMRLVGMFDRRLKFFVPSLGKKHMIDSGKARRLLDWSPRSLNETVLHCAESLAAVGALR